MRILEGVKRSIRGLMPKDPWTPYPRYLGTFTPILSQLTISKPLKR
jgi:hypothetical protein